MAGRFCFRLGKHASLCLNPPATTHLDQCSEARAFVTIAMMTGRVRRGGFTFTLRLEAGQAAISLSNGEPTSSEPHFLSCSIVGLHNVLGGTEYLAVASGQHCLLRRQDKHVELVWKRKQTETVIRLSVAEYRNLLKAGGENSRSAA